MSFLLGKQSTTVLSMAHPDFEKIVKLALSWGIIDFAIVESFRTEMIQNQYHQEGLSRVVWPHSKHNSNPSLACDIVPYINNKLSYNWKHCLVLAGVILAAAKSLNITLRWGGNWDMDGEPITDQDFQDLVHYEKV